ncbi:MAG: cytidylate kinase-like family protein [Eubacteriales bacterium]|nr:cytidylate kinase-like family protein [Eubacteriales bacterium]
MKIITISREFGSGGRELGKRLADELGFAYYDREIITSIANSGGRNEDYVKNALENYNWQNVPLTFRHSFAGSYAMQTAQTNLLLQQKRVIEGIAQTGKDSVIVGRNADVLLKEYHPFHLFVCADMETKVQRCIERADMNEQLSRREIERNIRRIDKNRSWSREIITDSKWGERSAYHLIVNTTDWSIKELTPSVADFINSWFGRTKI